MASITGYTAEELDKRPQGIIKTAEATHVGNISALVDLLNTSVTFTAEAGRSYKVSFTACFLGVSITLVTCGIYDGSNTEIRALKKTIAAANGSTTISGFVVLTPGAGSKTYKLRAQSSVGNITAATPHNILVEDLGVTPT